MPLPLIRLGLVDSTQDFLGRHPELGFCGVLAGAQSQGRGRRGNSWESARDQGLWLTAALPIPSLPPGLLPQLAMAAVAEVLERLCPGDAPLGAGGAPLGLKWPNDLVARHQGRLVKLGGILGQLKGERLLLGVGINLHSAPVIPGRAMAIGCLAELRGQPLPERSLLAQAILAAWEDLGQPREPAFRWPAPGDPLRWEEGQGHCQAWLPDGRLAVRTATGVHNLTAGELFGLAGD